MGRPKSFDRDEVLGRALGVFLRNGYEAASVQDLVTETGVNRFSLYECFGDKHNLFLAALDRYHADRREAVANLLSRPGRKIDLIREYFETIIEGGLCYGTSGLPSGGCLMVNSAMALARTDEEVAERAARHFAALEEMFTDALATAVEQGEIKLTRNVRSVARFLLNNARGVRVTVAYTHDREVVDDVMATIWSVIEETSSPRGIKT
jgi:TetR/AcrR family transcriptional regulator, transcriptional repressor for nem operon